MQPISFKHNLIKGRVMITTNILTRTFHIRVGDLTGTCFAIDVNNKQYIVTAKHVVSDLLGTSTIAVFHENIWKDISVTLVGHASDGIDISVLATNFQISTTFPIVPTTAGISLGQDVYFLGFPYAMSGGGEEVNRNFPLPFIKKAILSCIDFYNDINTLYLDGHNNPGFSGGPVIFQEPNSPDFKVAGVISGFRCQPEPIFQENQATPLSYRYNTGIIISYGIKHAKDIIENNPIGFTIS